MAARSSILLRAAAKGPRKVSRGLLESMRDYYRTKAAEFYARARNESDVMTRRQYESLASQYSRIAEIADRGRDRRTVYASHRQPKSGVKHN
jgi:hypothetical protein